MKKPNSIKLSPYIITWVEVRPFYGIIPIKDLKKMKIAHGIEKNRGYAPFPNKEKALEWIEKTSQIKLSKSYQVRMFSDKQFSMAKMYRLIPFTKKQWEDVYYL